MTVAVRAWAERYIAAHPRPDFTVLGAEDVVYLQRWYIVPRNDTMNVYLHRFLGPDPDTPHDHRGDNKSWVLGGRYLEHLYSDDLRTHETRELRAGDTVTRAATQLHRVELIDNEPAVSLFFIGPIVREWGFRCPDRWVHFEEYIRKEPGLSGTGRGCG